MHIIARPAISEAQRRHPDAADWLDGWWQGAGNAAWAKLADVRRHYPDTDQVGQCLIFNVRGNNYRLICRVTYANQWTKGTLLFRHFLTHAEYDKNKWCKGCIPLPAGGKAGRGSKKGKAK
jgi:mRNA interferase HigB